MKDRLAQAARLLRRGEVEQAVAAARSLVQARPGHPLAENFLGLCLLAHGSADEALELFEPLLRRNPDMVSLCFNAGLAALREEDETRATAHLQRAVSLEPGHRRALALLALVNLRRGQRFVAKDLLSRAGLDDLAHRVEDASEAELALELAVELDSRALALPPPGGAEAPGPAEGFAEFTPPGGIAEADSGPSPDGLAETEEALAETTPVALASELETPIDPATQPLWPPATEAWDVGEVTRPMPLLVPPPPGGLSVDLDLPPAPPLPLADADLPAPGARPQVEESPGAHAPAQPAAVMFNGAEQHQKLFGLVPLDGPEVEQRLGWLLVRTGALAEETSAQGAGVAVRGSRQVLRLGNLAGQPAAPDGWAEAGGGPTDLLQITGEGLVALDPGQQATLEVLHLEGEECHVQAGALLACSGALERRAGRMKPATGEPLFLFHLEGAGFVALRWPAPVQSFQVTPESPLALRPRYLAAWTGPLDARLSGENSTGGDAMVHLSGSGLALVGAAPLDKG